MQKMTKRKAAMLLADVPEDKRFRCSDGRVFKNLSELENALNDMTAEIFRYHSSEGKSDFANWVRDVIRDEEVARNLSESNNAAQAARSVRERIAWLKGKIQPK
jgi:hypothetical protein